MEAIDYEEIRKYAWSYFSLHAEQRLKTFNFFILISAFIFTSMAALVRVVGISYWMSLPMFAISLLAYAFWQLDMRNRELVGVAEEALKDIELEFMAKVDLPVILCPFVNEAVKTEEMIKKGKGSWSYSKCFKLTFFGFGSTGLFAGLFILYYSV